MGGRTNDGSDDRSDDGSDPAWVFDDTFVAGGIREDSLRHARPTPSPRSPLRNPTGPRDWTPNRTGGIPRRRRGRLRLLVLLLVAATGVAGLVRLVTTSGHSGPEPIAARTSTPAAVIVRGDGTTVTPSATRADPSAHPVNGITPTTAVGTCLTGTARPGFDLDVHEASCGRRHNFELIAFERAAGDDDTYPDDSYWHGPVAQHCYADLRHYVGQPRDRWPAYLSPTQFIPQPAGWATGDRVVYCLAELGPATAGTVRHLPAARPSVIAPSDPAPVDAAGRTVTGRLFVQTQGSDVCLAVRSAAYTGPVVAAGAGLSWRAAIDLQGRPDDSGSGIAVAPEARADNLRWHAGDRVTLTGEQTDAAGAGCGSSTVFGFRTVRTAR